MYLCVLEKRIFIQSTYVLLRTCTAGGLVWTRTYSCILLQTAEGQENAAGKSYLAGSAEAF